jgi:hypothetical protein
MQGLESEEEERREECCKFCGVEETARREFWVRDLEAFLPDLRCRRMYRQNGLDFCSFMSV